MLAAVLALQAPALAHGRPQGGAEPRFEDEITKQEAIYRSQGKSIPGGYILGRGLGSYRQLLPAGFEAALKKLGAKDRWLDIGAGSGNAILEYYAPGYRGGKARAVALSIEDRRTDLWKKRAASLKPGQISYLFSKRLRDYPDEELGKFRMITDVYGGFSYTDDLSRFMTKLLGLMEVDGSFYTLIQSVHLEDGKDKPTTWYLTEIVDEAGRDVNVCSWLKRITCVTVTCDSRSDWDTPTELIHMRKTCDQVAVPALEPVFYEAGTPPGRKFKLK